MSIFARPLITLSAGVVLATGALASGCASNNAQTQRDAIEEALRAVEAEPTRAVITVRTERHVKAALKSLEGLSQLETPVESVRFLVFGEAIHALQKGSELEEDLKAAMESGVQISACELAMKVLEIDANTLIDGVDLVNHVFVEAIRLQQHGWISIEY